VRRPFSRRSVLKAGATVGLAGAVGVASAARRDQQKRLVDLALASSVNGPASLDDIEHIVILTQENHSFDQYFGCYRGVRGYGDVDVLRQPEHDNLPIWYQFGWGPGDTKADPAHYTLPFHLDMSNPRGDAACVADPTHAWGPQHASWNSGRMDSFMAAHIANDGLAVGPQVMGYYTGEDIGFYWDLADAFTLCDNYHCSVMSDTTPNRLHVVSATIDPDGLGGGPITSNPGTYFSLLKEPAGGPSWTWTTMPDVLQEAGVSWKAYQPPGSQIDDGIGDNVLLYFKKFQDIDSPMFINGVLPSFPGDFQADVAAGTLPAVSWIMSMGGIDEHPPSPIILGDLAVTQQILATLLSNPAVWEKTVLIVTYDENGGFFDHVSPLTSPSGTPGEWITARPTIGNDSSDTGTLEPGPVGLGFRVPCLVISPLSAGGLVCSDVLDHTSMLRLIERRFGTEVPNLSAWRRSVTGDMTRAINFAGGVPSTTAWAIDLLTDAKIIAHTPVVPESLDIIDEDCVADIESDEIGIAGLPPASYPVPSNQEMPVQQSGTAASPSGLV
jgi:phospholipase C